MLKLFESILMVFFSNFSTARLIGNRSALLTPHFHLFCHLRSVKVLCCQLATDTAMITKLPNPKQSDLFKSFSSVTFVQLLSVFSETFNIMS